LQYTCAPPLPPAGSQGAWAARMAVPKPATGSWWGATTRPPVARRPVFLLFGDSLTQYAFDSKGGWGTSLAHHYQRKVGGAGPGAAGAATQRDVRTPPALAVPRGSPGNRMPCTSTPTVPVHMTGGQNG
jgi:hypothetical protein